MKYRLIDINDFLLARLSNSTDRSECQAIVDFYITMDSSRWHQTLLGSTWRINKSQSPLEGTGTQIISP
jgi:ribulose kinase